MRREEVFLFSHIHVPIAENANLGCLQPPEELVGLLGAAQSA